MARKKENYSAVTVMTMDYIIFAPFQKTAKLQKGFHICTFPLFTTVDKENIIIYTLATQGFNLFLDENSKNRKVRGGEVIGNM
jgi:hypothetical protein